MRVEQVKPTARGWIHFYSAVGAVASGGCLLWRVPRDLWVATAVYVASLVAMFATSAAYHVVTWRSSQRRLLMKRLDHSGIFLFIAGSYTFFAAACVAEERARRCVVCVAWAGALLGIFISLLWPRAPRLATTPIYVALGWLILFVYRHLQAPSAAIALLTLGGVAYTVGALCYAFSWPNPYPKHYGYHEVFHTLVTLAALLQLAAAWLVAPLFATPLF